MFPAWKRLTVEQKKIWKLLGSVAVVGTLANVSFPTVLMILFVVVVDCLFEVGKDQQLPLYSSDQFALLYLPLLIIHNQGWLLCLL